MFVFLKVAPIFEILVPSNPGDDSELYPTHPLVLLSRFGLGYYGSREAARIVVPSSISIDVRFPSSAYLTSLNHAVILKVMRL